MTDQISYEEFKEIQMVVAKIKEAQEVEGADKLFKVSVDLGDEVKTMIAGGAEVYEPEDLTGKRVVAVKNLEPSEIFGIESRGMVLAAVQDDGSPVFIDAPEDVELGARVE